MTATWKNLHNRSKIGWNVVEVFQRSNAFSSSTLVAKGFDNTRPDESLNMTANRIAKHFGIDKMDLVLEICA